MAWAFDDEEVQIWIPGQPLPERIVEHIEHGGEIRAWNAQFERIIWREIMAERYFAPAVLDEQWVDTAAEAAAMALPRGLDQCAIVLRVKEKKDQEGYGLMMRMTRPRSIVNGRPVWWTDPEKLQRLYAYCKQDVRVERVIAKAVRRLSPLEREIYLMDQRINDRGVGIDRELILAAQEVAAEGIARADATLDQLTDGAVHSVTNHLALTKWVWEQGVETDGVSKKAIKEMLESDLSPDVRHVLQLRSDAGRTSIAKLDTMLSWASAPDDRARGMAFYHAASTGRWGGKGPQPHNFPRGEITNVEFYIKDILARQYDTIALAYHPVVVVSSMLRSMWRAKAGNELIAADYSAIEARVLNWLAGQDDVLETFREYDAGDKTKDPYLVMARKIGPLASRQAGKAAELGCGYQMGAGKFVTAAWDVYQVRVNEEEAEKAVAAYRASHDKVVALWKETEEAVIEATRNPGKVVLFGAKQRLKCAVAGAYLYLILPSGRPLAFAAPKVVTATVHIKATKTKAAYSFTKDAFEFSGVDPFTKQWGRLRAYGGLLVENIVQAVSRDLLAEGMLRLEKSGYPPILSVHDEAVSEVQMGFGSVHEYEQILAQLPEWAQGCPVRAEGWRGERYRK